MNMTNIKVSARRLNCTAITTGLNTEGLANSIHKYAKAIDYRAESRTVAIGVCIANLIRNSHDVETKRRLNLSKIGAMGIVAVMKDEFKSVSVAIMKFAVEFEIDLSGTELTSLIEYANLYLNARQKEKSRPNFVNVVLGKINH